MEELKRTDYKEVVVENAGHGYGAALGTDKEFRLREFIEWLQELQKIET